MTQETCTANASADIFALISMEVFMRVRMKRGFTLIELLVVIAIIAILAAILFPVFAQARAKARQTACLSNYKQNALSFTQYAQDYDEHMPQALPLRNGAWNYSKAYHFPVPANLFNDPPAQQAVWQAGWANEIQPYAKNVQVLDCPSSKSYDLVGTDKTVGPAPRVALEFNGLMTSYPLAGMLGPASAILMWNGDQKTAWVGGFGTEPLLWCPNPGEPCVYKPSFNPADPSNSKDPSKCPYPSPSGTTASTLNGATSYAWRLLDSNNKPLPIEYSNVWLHGAGDNFVFADGHAKWRPLAPAVSPSQTDGRVNPYAYVDNTGNTDINGGGTTEYVSYCYVHYLFRPDYQN